MTFLAGVFLRNTFGRFLGLLSLKPSTGRYGGHVEPFYDYLLESPGSLVPWALAWIAALGSSFPWRRSLLDWRRTFLLVVFLAGLLLLSCSVSKRTVYLLPLLPLTVAQAALWLDDRLAARGAEEQGGLERAARSDGPRPSG